MKQGIHTSEFWLAIVTVVAALVLAVTDSVDGETALTAIGGVSAAYGFGRAWVKGREI